MEKTAERRNERSEFVGERKNWRDGGRDGGKR
jgi:hypothetical protein